MAVQDQSVSSGTSTKWGVLEADRSTVRRKGSFSGDYTEQSGRGIAAYDVTRFSAPAKGYRIGVHVDAETGLESFTDISQPRDKGAFQRYVVTYLPRPEKWDLVVAVRKRTEGEPGDWEHLAAGAVQRKYVIEVRHYVSEGLLLIFAAKQEAQAVFNTLRDAGLAKGHTKKFDLRKIRNDPDKDNVFQAWARGTGRIATHAYFGFDVLDDEELRTVDVKSVRVSFKTADGKIVLHVSDDGRISQAGEGVTYDELEGLYRRLNRYLAPSTTTLP